MGLEDEGQRTELTREERERRATVLLLCRLVSERHRQEQQRIKADARARRLRQEVGNLDAYNMESLQAESEAVDLRTEVLCTGGRAAPFISRRTRRRCRRLSEESYSRSGHDQFKRMPFGHDQFKIIWTL
jgi:hypothetical protein